MRVFEHYMFLFKQKKEVVDVPASLRTRLDNVEGLMRDLDARLLNVEHDAKALRDKVLRKLQTPREPEELNTSANVELRRGQPLRRGITR